MADGEALKQLKQEEKDILREVEKITHAEKRIDEEEQRILEAEKKIIKGFKGNPFKSLSIDEGLTKREVGFFRLFFSHKAGKHKLLFALIGTIAVVFIWRGIWHTTDEIPILNYSLVSLLIGLLILWFIKKYTNLR